MANDCTDQSHDGRSIADVKIRISQIEVLNWKYTTSFPVQRGVPSAQLVPEARDVASVPVRCRIHEYE